MYCTYSFYRDRTAHRTYLSVYDVGAPSKLHRSSLLLAMYLCMMPSISPNRWTRGARKISSQVRKCRIILYLYLLDLTSTRTRTRKARECVTKSGRPCRSSPFGITSTRTTYLAMVIGENRSNHNHGWRGRGGILKKGLGQRTWRFFPWYFFKEEEQPCRTAAIGKPCAHISQAKRRICMQSAGGVPRDGSDRAAGGGPDPYPSTAAATRKYKKR